MDYITWATEVKDIFTTMYDGDAINTPYFPKSTKFIPVTTASFIHDGHFYEVKNHSMGSVDEVETFLDTTENVALFYVGINNKTGSINVRYTIIGQDQLKPVTVDEFLKDKNLHTINSQYGTVSGIQEQMKNISGIVYVFYLVQSDKTSISLIRATSDGSFIYV